jgi:hypothetical protein
MMKDDESHRAFVTRKEGKQDNEATKDSGKIKVGRELGEEKKHK